MSTIDQVVAYAAKVHRRVWAKGTDVSGQTCKAQKVCKQWQEQVIEKFGDRFRAEMPLNESGPSQKIDIVDLKARVAYELKSSPNNVHMEIYRDVFKALVFNERNSETAIRKLVFVAPSEGVRRLGRTFPKDVQKIAAKVGLKLEIRELP